jgi:hypothetical protein
MTASLPPGSSSGRLLWARRRVAAIRRKRLSLGGVAWLMALLILIGIACDQVRREGGFRVDDAYITFSFSKNLAAGNGPIFSHGLRVEGYSNFLWMLLVAVRFLFSAQGDPYNFARAVAFGCLAVALFAAYRLARRAATPATALVAVALLVSCSDLFRAAASGLETAAYCAAIAVGWAVYLSEQPDRRRWSLVAFVPAALMRIDGFVPLLIVFGFEVLSLLAQGRLPLLKLARWAAPAFGIWAAYFAWRYEYYGLPLPTTYYAKSVVSVNDPDRGFRQAWDFMRDYGALPLLPLLFLPVVRGPRRAAVGLAIAVLLQVMYAATVGGDWMPFNRFFLPIVPLAAVLVAWGSEQLWRSMSAYGFFARWASRTALGAALAFAAVHMHSASIDTPQEREKVGTAETLAQHTIGNLLAVKDLMAYVVRRPGDRLVTDYPGVFSVFTDAEIIDMWGLCNEDIALHGGTNGINPIYGKECAACYARLKPDYFHVGVPIARAENSFRSVPEIIANIFQGPAIDRVIQLRKNFAAGRVVEESTGRALWFLERRRDDLPLETRRPAARIRVDYPFEAPRGKP